MSSPINYRLELTEAAENDLEAILNYTSLQWGEQQVNIYLAVIEKALQFTNLALKGRGLPEPIPVT